MQTHNPAFHSAIIYTTISLALASFFFLAAATLGYDWIARIGGAAWVFMLSMIVLMPIVTPLVKRRMEKD